jgi:hypothetical protein
MRAAHVVGQHAAQAKQAVPDLIRLLGDPRPSVRWIAAEALGKFGADGREAAPALRELATADPEATVRDVAGRALRQMGLDEQSQREEDRPPAQLLPVREPHRLLIGRRRRPRAPGP